MMFLVGWDCNGDMGSAALHLQNDISVSIIVTTADQGHLLLTSQTWTVHTCKWVTEILDESKPRYWSFWKSVYITGLILNKK